MPDPTCPACDSPVKPAAAYCDHCGQPLSPAPDPDPTPGPDPTPDPDPTKDPDGPPETEAIRQGIRLRAELIPISAGTFEMGSHPGEHGRSQDEQLHPVTLSRPFDLSRTPVTQAAYAAVTGVRPSLYPGERRPVEQVSWFDAVAFCNSLSLKEGLRPAYRVAGRDVTWDPDAPGFRLPTEAEWEYAARAGGRGPFAGDLSLDQVGWWRRDGNAGTEAVASRRPNAWGLYDLTGNVWEWCWDVFARYPEGPATDPTGPATGTFRVNRGGSWSETEPRLLRIAARDGNGPDARQSNLGFRIARTLL